MTIRILHGDCRSILPTLADASVQCCVTSPPYFGLRDYGVAGQIGLEPTPDEYVAALVETFRGVRRVLRDDGTLWLNLGDSYASNWPCNRRSIMGAGQRFLLQSTGWRQSCACPPAPPSPCVVLDPFFGAGTTGLVADRLGRDCIGIELSPAYTTMAGTRVTNDAGLFAEVAHV